MDFEGRLAEINQAIASKKSLWDLYAISYIDYDDVAQQIRIHIYNKLHLYDPKKGSFLNWASKIVQHKIKNIRRDNYGKVAPPCNRCPFNNGDNFCAFTKSGVRDFSCKAYKKWSRLKKDAYSLKLTLPIEEYDGSVTHSDFDIEKGIASLNEKMKERLSPKQYLVYKMLYIDGLGEEDVTEALKFKKTKEAGRVAGYRQLGNLKKQIYEIANQIVREIDL